MMKVASVLLALAACSSSLSIRNPEQAVLGEQGQESQYLIETAPGDRRWVSEDEKWVLRRVSGAICHEKINV